MASPPVSIQNPQSFSSILNTFQNADNDKHVRFQGAKGLYTSQGGSLTAIKAFFGFDGAMKAREQKRADAYNNMRQAIDTEYGAGTADKLFKHMALEGRDLSKGVTVGDLQTMGHLLTTTEHERQRAAVGYDIVPELDRPGLDADYEEAFNKPAYATRLATEMTAGFSAILPSLNQPQLAAKLLPLVQEDPIDRAKIGKAVLDALTSAAAVDIPQTINIAPGNLLIPRLKRQFAELIERTPPGTLQDFQDAVRLNASRPALVARLAQDAIAKTGLNSPSMDMVALRNAIDAALTLDSGNQSMVEGAVKSAYVTAALIDLPAAMNINPAALGMMSLEKHCQDMFGASSKAGEAEVRAAISLNVQKMAEAPALINSALTRLNIANVGFDQRILADLITDMTRRGQTPSDDDFRLAVSRATILTASKAGDFEGILEGSKSLIGHYSQIAVSSVAAGGNPLGTFMRGKEGKEMVDALAPYLAPPAQQMVAAALNLPVPPDAAFTKNDLINLANGVTTPHQTFDPALTGQQKADAIEADTVDYLRQGLTAIFGGKDIQSIQRTVANLPDDVCITLATLHDEGQRIGTQANPAFGEALGRNIMNNAFFLRYINPSITNTASVTPTDDPKRAALMALSALTQSILNGSPPNSAGAGGVALYNEWKDVSQMFNDAVLLRGRALLAG